MSEESTTTPAEIDEALSRRISDALNSEDGIAGDPELGGLLAVQPEAMSHAKRLGRVGRWLAMWPLETPNDAEFEALASKIEARLGESFNEDFTETPFFESETPSRPPTEDGKAAIARIPLRRSPRSTITELPVLRRDPRSSDEEISLETLAIAAAALPEPHVVEAPKAVELVVETAAVETVVDVTAPTAAEPPVPVVPAKTPSIRPVSVPPPAVATKSERPKPAIVPKPRPDADASEKLAPVVSIRAANEPPAKAANERSWWPGLLAAAAVGLGAIGVASIGMNSSAPAPVAPATATQVPLQAPAALAAAPPPPAAAPAIAPAEAAFAGAPVAAIAPVAEAPTPVAPPESIVPRMEPAPIAEGSSGARARAFEDNAMEGVRGGLGGQGAAPAPAPAPAATTRAAIPSRARPQAAARRAATAPVAVLSRETVSSVMQGLLPQVLSCANGRHGTVPVDVVVLPTGSVTGATVTGSFQGTPEGSCIARAVRGAQFPSFEGEAPTRFRYPYAF